MKFDISVIICTYNRSDMLKDTLNSWIGVDTADILVELIIVDNNSNDLTKQVIDIFSKQYSGSLQCVNEINPGLSNARNAGIEKARGEIIAFVDDDIYFDKNWLIEIVNIFKQHPKVHCVGGKSIPKFEKNRPAWITDNFLNVYGSTQSGEKVKEMRYPEHPFGVNMAFRKDTFILVDRFNTKLGRNKNSLLSNEDNDMFFRADKAGLQTIYTPKAIVYHRIPEDRMQKTWLIRRYYWQGISGVAFKQLTIKETRLTLTRNILRSFKLVILGYNSSSFKSVLKYYRDFSFNNIIHSALLIGNIRQNFVEILTYKK